MHHYPVSDIITPTQYPHRGRRGTALTSSSLQHAVREGENTSDMALGRKSYWVVFGLTCVAATLYHLYAYDHGHLEEYQRLVSRCDKEKNVLYEALSQRRAVVGAPPGCPSCAPCPDCKPCPAEKKALAPPAEALPCKPIATAEAAAAAAGEPEWDFAIVVFVGHRYEYIKRVIESIESAKNLHRNTPCIFAMDLKQDGENDYQQVADLLHGITACSVRKLLHFAPADAKHEEHHLLNHWWWVMEHVWGRAKSVGLRRPNGEQYKGDILFLEDDLVLAEDFPDVVCGIAPPPNLHSPQNTYRLYSFC